jgi:hypothetical protein
VYTYLRAHWRQLGFDAEIGLGIEQKAGIQERIALVRQSGRTLIKEGADNMRNSIRRKFFHFGLALLTVSGLGFAQPVIPGNYAALPGSVNTGAPGFKVRTVQARFETSLPNSLARTEAHLAGTLIDPFTGLPYENEADLSLAGPDGYFIEPDVINYNQDALWGSLPIGNFHAFSSPPFPDDPIPGIPGINGHTDNISMEVLAFLELSAGKHRFGVNSDDGFKLTIGIRTSPQDAFAADIGQFDGGRGAADSQFEFIIEEAGIFPVRLIWEEGRGGANLEFFSMDPPTPEGTRILINDLSNPKAVRAYREIAGPLQVFAKTVSPAPGSTAVSPFAEIKVELKDGTAQVNPATVRLTVNGANVTPNVSRSGDITTVQYDPPGLLKAGSVNAVSLAFVDGGTPPVEATYSMSFSVQNYIGPNGNFYEIVRTDGITWEEANLAAQQRLGCMLPGHLATITSAEEDVYLDKLRQTASPGVGTFAQLWVGGFQPPGQPTPRDGWVWVNDEGPISGVNGGGTYANWAPNEPGDQFGPDTENYLTIGRFERIGWNDEGFLNGGQLFGYVVEYERLTVPIDVKPNASPNTFNMSSHGKLPVAILSTASFDATSIDPATVRFGKTGTEALPVEWAYQDLNSDGRVDLLVHFNTQDTAITCDLSRAWLFAENFDGCPIKGSDSIAPQGCPPYRLTIEAVEDVNHNTDLYLKYSVAEPGYSAPLSADQVQLKSYDLLGQLRWSRNLQNIVLSSGPDNTSSATLRFTDMDRFQRVQARSQARNATTGSTELVSGEGIVLLRPDLTLYNVNAPRTANLRQIVNFSVTVKNLNGDLGATANAYLMEGDVIVDERRGVSVRPHEEITIVFSTIFREAGTHQLRIGVSDVSPGDYDLANNEIAIAIETRQPQLESVTYFAEYWHTRYEYSAEYDDPYGSSSNYELSDAEWLWDQLFIPAALHFPINRVTIEVAADGVIRQHVEAEQIAATISTFDPCSIYRSGTKAFPDRYFVYAQSYTDLCSGYSASEVAFQKYPIRNVYFSSFHDKVWGTSGEVSFSNGLGEFLNATTTLDAWIMVEDEEGTFGGTATIPLYSEPFNSEWNDVFEGGFSRGYYRGINTAGSASGTTAP